MTSGVRMSIKARGLLNPAELARFKPEQRERYRQGVSAAMSSWGRDVARKVGAAAASALKTTGQRVPRSFRSRVYDTKPSRMPAVMIYSRIPWMGMHTQGGTATAKGKGLLIPLLSKRMGSKTFKRIVDRIMQSGAGFFKNVGGKVILFAEYQPEYGRPLARFRREYRSATGQKRVRAGTDIPIAVLVKSVSIKKSLHMDAIVRSHLGTLASTIESRVKF